LEFHGLASYLILQALEESGGDGVNTPAWKFSAGNGIASSGKSGHNGSA